MKKLSLLVAVFMLIAGMAFADVTFAPAVTGSADVTWGYDFDQDNSGFTASNSTSLDLGVTVDPVDAKSGSGVYGEVALTGLSVTAKSGADVAVAAPAISAKLFFAEGLYLRVAAAPDLTFDWAGPLGEMVDYGDDTLDGTWYDGGEDYNNSTVVVDSYYGTGYGVTYENGGLSVAVDFVSDTGWGTNDDPDIKFNTDDYTVFIEGDDYAYLAPGDFTTLETAVDTAVTNNSPEDDYYVRGEDVIIDGNPYVKVAINGDDNFELVEEEDGGDIHYVYQIDMGDGRTNSMYTAGVTVGYAMDGIGSAKVYVVPMHATEWETFTSLGMGFSAEITAVEMVGINLSGDFYLALDADAEDVSSDNEFEYELAVSLPITVADMLTANVKIAATDGVDAQDDATLDAYVDASTTVSGATIKGSYMMQNMGIRSKSAYTLGASYTMNGITPSVDWVCGLGEKAAGDEYGKITVAVAAAIIDNTTFTAKYASGDMLTSTPSEMGQGVFTFETKLSY